MTVNGVNRLKEKQREYEKMVSELESLMDNEDVMIDDAEKVHSYFDEFENILHKLKSTTNKIIKKILLTDIKENKNNDKDSLEYNKALLYNGKPHKAIEQIKLLAEKDDLEAQLFLGKIYLNGIVGPHNEKLFNDEGLAVHWLGRAYKGGLTDAGYLLGIAEQRVLNIEKALSIFSKLADNDHLRSLNELLIIYKNHPVYKNEKKYLMILEKINSTRM